MSETAQMITTNIAWGLRRSMAVAVAFAAIVSIEYVFLGPRTTCRIGVTLPTILLMYIGGGLAAGIVLGAGRPLAKTRVGSMILGVFVATCVYGSGCLAVYGPPNHWHGLAWSTTIVLGVGMGAFVGGKFFDDFG